MTPWQLIDRAPAPDGGAELRLYRRGEEYSIKAGPTELMSSRVHGSEEALAQLTCARLDEHPQARLLVGGLGMGYTLAAALDALGTDAQVVVAERAPAVVAWNRGPLADLARRPLEDPRATVYEGDVADLVRAAELPYDAILLDVDNGPEGLSHKDNQWLYEAPGLAAAFAALRPGGILAVWSVSPDAAFTQRLRQAGYTVEEALVRARGRRGARHWIWFAKRPG